MKKISSTSFQFENWKFSLLFELFGIWDISGIQFEEPKSSEKLILKKVSTNDRFWLKSWLKKSSCWLWRDLALHIELRQTSVPILIVSGSLISQGLRKNKDYASHNSSETRKLSSKTLMSDVQLMFRKKI